MRYQEQTLIIVHNKSLRILYETYFSVLFKVDLLKFFGLLSGKISFHLVRLLPTIIIEIFLFSPLLFLGPFIKQWLLLFRKINIIFIVNAILAILHIVDLYYLFLPAPTARLLLVSAHD